jgi:hypothetical protein
MAAEPGWRVFRDAHGTTLEYPSGIFANDAGEGTPKGTVLTTTDGRARLHIFDLRGKQNENARQFVRRLIEERGERLSYRRVAKNFFAFSDARGKFILYRRCNFAHDAVIHCIDIRYPRGEKRAWDNIVTRISRSLRPL